MILRDAVNRLDTGAAHIAYPSDPFAFVLYENAGYLVDDERRAALFERLIALAPTAEALRDADRTELLAIAREGGMHPETRVDRWYETARITLDKARGDLRGTLLVLDPAKRRSLLGSYPTIGDPGADKIVLFCAIAPEPSGDSHVLRVLERLQLIPVIAYPQQYRLARELQRAAYGSDGAALRRAYDVLRAHGKDVCRRALPDREHCPIAASCAGTLTSIGLA